MAAGKRKKIAIIGGDGIGPSVTAEAKLLLELYQERAGLPIDLWELDLGADRYLRDGTTFPNQIQVAIQRECSAVLLGALGDPRVPNLEHARDILFGMRFGYDLYANVRPVRALSDRLVPLKGRAAKDIDFVVFRENTEGIYVGVGGQFKRGTADEVAINEDINTRKGVERIIRAAFDYARANGRTRVTMADKSNAMRHAHELWLRVFQEVRAQYPEIQSSHVYVDALCLYLIQDPSQFQVIVTNNLFGDIVTDLGAALQGGLGMAASANVHASDPARVALFEPVHGSAPPLTGKDVANPFAAMLTAGLLLAHLGWPEEERRIERWVSRALDQGMCTVDVGGTLGTRAAGAWVREQIAAELGPG
ncbi:isocitrate/isopropylmalate dehydrogenase family protein [Sorangium sp. So ce854]|uniref:3-isopropylmalate dehydrogenase n=1 Tax=Sorangium cellulosum TaxID=56 RepID=A0A150PPY3_SORCE|nr:3-isopropylmalate dehydrogenase [Sorangium cellulosum]